MTERAWRGSVKRAVSRREFLYLAAAAAGSTVLAACGGNTNQSNNNGNGGTRTAGNQRTPGQSNIQSPPAGSSTQAQPANTTGGATTAPNATASTGGGSTTVATRGTAPTLPVPSSFKESPDLTAQVKAGKLPKVSERLPKTPVVLKPVERIGNYGGTLKQAMVGKSTTFLLDSTMGYECLTRWVPNTRQFTMSEVGSDIAKSFRANSDGSEYTFELRQGMKWSDGEPFTADDIMFWYEDVYSNKDLTPAYPGWLTADGKPLKVVRNGDYEVTFKFPAPHGLFLQNLSTWRGRVFTSYPRHYLEQFHKRYNPKVEQEAKNAGLDSWPDLFDQKTTLWVNKNLPVLYPWKTTNPLGEGTQQVEAERNPYYWKVDTEGNQLPYLDKVVFNIVQNGNVELLQALNGELDFVVYTINTLSNKPLFYKNQQKGNYHFIDLPSELMNSMVLWLNMTHKDPVKRKVFSNKDFRVGLSYAMNRQEIIDVVFQGQGEPFQCAPRPESIFYNQQLAKQYTEYDVGKANEHLDKVLPEKDSQGVRLGPDGKPFAFQVEFAAGVHTEWADTLDMIKGYWQKVGVDMTPKSESTSLFTTRRDGNEHDAGVWEGAGGLASMLRPQYYFPWDTWSAYGIPWEIWFNDPKSEAALEPPPAAKKQMDLYKQIQGTVDQQKQIELMKQILEIAVDQFWLMGITLPTKGYGVVQNNLHNVPGTMLRAGGVYLYPAPTNPPQYFIKT